MILSKKIQVTSGGYAPGATFASNSSSEERIEKLTVKVFGDDVILQPSEEDPVIFTDEATTEIYLEKGFHSLVPITVWTGFRFRKVNANATVNFTAYG